ncbi:response regulator [Paenibacillus sp. LHD-117]|uniref:response regulator n=1 Tax=Paenibacillus sp. LHD-117 TaxID=3071412 RepID=UPI0027E08F3C|nr:response regulator [Paenibacillus sp. LHD-117]MDQ6417838.1 response regulator [Paenibacillus sp. LHD-117]
MSKKIFFVDDEIVIRENIRSCIDWEKEGFFYCGDAPDGELALPMIEEHRPDILITDIKMPFMNGLELSTIVRKRFPDIKIVLLSGHDEFDYARQALRIGIEDYCLKPLDSTDIIKLMREVSTKIDREYEQKRKIDQLAQSLSDMEEESRDQLVSKLCGGIIASAEAVEMASMLGVPLLARHYAVIVTDIRVHIDSDHSAHTQVSDFAAEVTNLISENVDFLTSKRSRTETVWVLKSEQHETLRNLLDLLTEKVKMNESSHSSHFSIGIGSIQDRLQGVHDSFLEAEEDKYWRRLTEQHRRTLFELSSSFDVNTYLDRDAFIEYLSTGSPRQAEKQIRQLALGLADVEWSTSLFGFYTLSDLTFEVIRKAIKLYRTVPTEVKHIEKMKEIIRLVKSFDEACDYLIQLANQFWKWRLDSASKYGDLIAQVKSYVQNHFGQEGLSLQDAADQVNVSASHLSKVFSQETGQTFTEFLMMTRIRKAIELMQSTNAKSYEIANEIGYSDPHYFSNLFKRVTGMTIRDFRKHGQLEDFEWGQGGMRGA